MPLFINEKELKNFHFVGVLGIGMSAIAQYLAKDCQISGSDRSIGSAVNAEDEKILKSQGISLFLQDGSGITPKTQALVVSTAIENDNPDIKKANELNIPIFHRSEVLAAIVKKCCTISVTGTSGKSSVSAMIFHILDFAGKNASFIGGANLHYLRKKGLLGNAFRAENSNEKEILVIEADESDGSVVRYFPKISVLLNISRDHKEIAEVVSLLKTASNQSNLTIFNKDDENFTDFCGKTFGFSPKADFHPIRWSCAENSAAFTIGETSIVVNFTGNHTISNALAAFAVCTELKIEPNVIAEALQTYSGIARRFDKYSAKNGILVIDDYAHNPDKISSAIFAAQMRKSPVSVVFQPHGFGPLKFMFDDLKEMFAKTLREEDKLYLLPTFYAGGTADKSVDSDKMADELGDKNRFIFVESREKLSEILKKSVKENESVLICGARDNSLAVLAKNLAESL
jgi:UDP-N-acetylmuramate--alanine ligase